VYDILQAINGYKICKLDQSYNYYFQIKHQSTKNSYNSMTATLHIQQARTYPSSNNQLSQSVSNINSQNQNGAKGDTCISADLKNPN
jgi:hypothetical protein